jgi:pimeloyl-ACP methyl ester carboxylesterase
VRLASAGFSVLRFDYYGCGDSARDCREGHVRQWLTDIDTAVGELKSRCGLKKICLIGLRLGGALALMAGAQIGSIDAMVLWDPVVRGADYLTELSSMHHELLATVFANWADQQAENEPTELLGFPLTDVMSADLTTLDVFGLAQKPASAILVLEVNGADRGKQWKAFVERFPGMILAYQRYSGPRFYYYDPHAGGVPGQALDAVVRWLAEVCP